MLNKNYPPYLRVVCGVILKHGFVLIAQRSEKMHSPLKWEFPGGKIDDHETETDALSRELAEELSIQVQIGERLPEVNHSEGPRRLQLIPYICYYDGLQPIIPIEHKQFNWVRPEELFPLDWAEADIPIARYVQEHWSRLQLSLLDK